jgi:hypothetical protein
LLLVGLTPAKRGQRNRGTGAVTYNGLLISVQPQSLANFVCASVIEMLRRRKNPGSCDLPAIDPGEKIFGIHSYQKHKIGWFNFNFWTFHDNTLVPLPS